jgi:hypothetical protein
MVPIKKSGRLVHLSRFSLPFERIGFEVAFLSLSE